METVDHFLRQIHKEIQILHRYLKETLTTPPQNAQNCHLSHTLEVCQTLTESVLLQLIQLNIQKTDNPVK